VIELLRRRRAWVEEVPGTGGSSGLPGAALLIATLACAAPLRAQEAGTRLEIRVDHHLTGVRSTEGGIGAFAPVGTYVRAGAVLAAGVASDASGSRRAARGEGALRFQLDPFRERRIGVAVGGGVVARWAEDDRVRPYLLALVDLEGRGRLAPAVQVALGGGLRVGVLLRPESGDGRRR
jgi:hypothetical protein